MQTDIQRLQEKIKGLESKLKKQPVNLTNGSIQQSHQSLPAIEEQDKFNRVQ